MSYKSTALSAEEAATMARAGPGYGRNSASTLNSSAAAQGRSTSTTSGATGGSSEQVYGDMGGRTSRLFLEDRPSLMADRGSAATMRSSLTLAPPPASQRASAAGAPGGEEGKPGSAGGGEAAGPDSLTLSVPPPLALRGAAGAEAAAGTAAAPPAGSASGGGANVVLTHFNPLASDGGAPRSGEPLSAGAWPHAQPMVRIGSRVQREGQTGGADGGPPRPLERVFTFGAAAAAAADGDGIGFLPMPPPHTGDAPQPPQPFSAAVVQAEVAGVGVGGDSRPDSGKRVLVAGLDSYLSAAAASGRSRGNQQSERSGGQGAGQARVLAWACLSAAAVRHGEGLQGRWDQGFRPPGEAMPRRQGRTGL